MNSHQSLLGPGPIPGSMPSHHGNNNNNQHHQNHQNHQQFQQQSLIMLANGSSNMHNSNSNMHNNNRLQPNMDFNKSLLLFLLLFI